MMNPLKFVALLGAALWLFAGANIFRVVVGDRRSQVFVNILGCFIWCSGTGYMLYLYPSHETKYEVHCVGRKIQHLFTHLSNSSATGIQLQTILSLWPSVWELLELRGDLAFWLLPNWFHDVVITLTTVGIITLTTVGIWQHHNPDSLLEYFLLCGFLSVKASRSGLAQSTSTSATWVTHSRSWAELCEWSVGTRCGRCDSEGWLMQSPCNLCVPWACSWSIHCQRSKEHRNQKNSLFLITTWYVVMLRREVWCCLLF